MTRVFKLSLSFVVLGVSASCVLAQDPSPRPRSANNRSIYIHKAGGSYLGIGVAEVDAERAKALNLKEARGVEVKSVDEDSPAAKAGLKDGDVVLEYNGQRIEGTEQFVRLVRETPVDRQVRMVIARNGNSMTLTATIGRRQLEHFSIGGDGDDDIDVEIPEMPPMPPMPAMPRTPAMPPMPDFPHAMTSLRTGMLGIECESLGSQLAEFFGVKEGVLVRSVAKNSPAEKAGLHAGDVIVKVAGEVVSNPQDITSQVRSASRDKHTFPVVVVRDKRELILNVTLESGGRLRGLWPVTRPVVSC